MLSAFSDGGLNLDIGTRPAFRIEDEDDDEYEDEKDLLTNRSRLWSQIR